MKKIPSVFQRDYEGDRCVIDAVVPGSEWVLEGEGVATRKWDGVAVRVLNGVVWKRYDAKKGRTPPPSFEPAQAEADATTGHWPGWVLADAKQDWIIFDAIAWGRKNLFGGGEVPDGTYEACSPKIGTRHGANPEGLSETILAIHGADVLPDCPRTFEGLREYLRDSDMEGVVFHHPDGRRCKLKGSDFGFKRRAGTK